MPSSLSRLPLRATFIVASIAVVAKVLLHALVSVTSFFVDWDSVDEATASLAIWAGIVATASAPGRFLVLAVVRLARGGPARTDPTREEEVAR